MHSIRMRTACSSSHHRGSPHTHTHPGAGTPWSRHPPPKQAPPGAGTPNRAGTPPGPGTPSISPLTVGLDQIPLNFPLGCGPGNLQGMLGYHPKLPRPPPPPETCCKACWDTTCNACLDSTPPPPVDRILDTCF